MVNTEATGQLAQFNRVNTEPTGQLTVQQGKHRVHWSTQFKQINTEPTGQLTQFCKLNTEPTALINLKIKEVTQSPPVNLHTV